MIGRSRAFVTACLACLAACGAAPKSPAPATESTTAEAPAPAPAPAPAAPARDAAGTSASVEPTQLTAEQLRQDAQAAPLAQAVVDAYPNLASVFSPLVAQWSPDGKAILFGSLRDGSPQIYTSDPSKPADAAAPVTRGPERAIWANYTPDGKYIAFLRDQRGDENHHIWRQDLDGSGLVDLTPGEPWHRREPVLPRDAPGIMLYSASRVSAPETVVFEQRYTGGPARQAYVSPRPGWLAGATADGKRALFSDAYANNNVVLHEIDVVASTARRIYPPEGKTVSVTGAAYALDGARIFVATDEGSEASVVLALDARTGKRLARYASPGPRGAQLRFVVSPDGKHLALCVSAGNHGELRVLDARTLRLERALKLPLGDVEIGTFSPDSKQLSLLLSLPDKPADIYAADVATGALRPLRDEPRPGIDALPKLTASIANVPAFDKLAIPVNVYLPADAGARKHPVIVIFHGGPASSSSVRWNPYVRFFVALGYVVLEPNVRGSTGFGRAYEMADDREKRADWLKDLEAVNAWTKRQPWCDPERVVVWGQSYGGYTTLMALTRQPTLWRAGVDLYGVADLKKFLATTDAAIRAVFVTEFGDLDRDGALLDEFSPIRLVDQIARPLFVYAGQNDRRVPRSESDAIVAAVRARNVPVAYMVAASEGHTVDRRETKVELLARTARFLAEALK